MVCQNNFKSLLTMALLFSMSSFALATTYLPPAVSLERKSLRVINMHGTVGLPKGQWEMFIQHRFGTFGDGAYNWYGFDQSYMRIGLDYGLGKRITTGASRSSMNKIADAYVKWEIPLKSKSWTASWYSNVSINTNHRATIAGEPFYYSNRLRFINTLNISKNFGDRLLIGVTPSFIHINLANTTTSSNDIPVIGGYTRLKLSNRYALTAEVQKPMSDQFYNVIGGYKNTNRPASPYLGLGFEIFTAKHMFQLSVSNAQSMNETYYMVGENGGNAFKNFRFGFNIVRRW